MKKILAVILMVTLAQSGVALAHDRDGYFGRGLHTPRVYVHDNNDGLAMIAGVLTGALAAVKSPSGRYNTHPRQSTE